VCTCYFHTTNVQHFGQHQKNDPSCHKTRLWAQNITKKRCGRAFSSEPAGNLAAALQRERTKEGKENNGMGEMMFKKQVTVAVYVP